MANVRNAAGRPAKPARAAKQGAAAAGARSTRRPTPRNAMRRATNPRAYQRQAQAQLRRFRQGSVLAVAVTGLLLLVWGLPPGAEGRENTDLVEPATTLLPSDPGAAMGQAANTMRELALGFYAFLPRVLVVLALLAVAALIARGVQWLLKRTLRGWERKEAAGALARLIVYLTAAIAAVSVLAGDVRAVVGSVGLFGLAASWALQTPIESFTGWLINSFRGYYRVGDRIAVGEVFGDVYRIDVLTTTVWEAGGPGKPVRAAQSTGALITFPNWEVLRSNVVNYSRDFPYVWDEIEFGVANESDLAYTATVIENTARRVLGPEMELAANEYQSLLDQQQIPIEVEELPRVYLSLADSWTSCTLRYLIPVRARRSWLSTLTLEISREMAQPAHRGRIVEVYPRHEVTVKKDWSAPEPQT